jgi:hypothetical protein
MDLADRAAQHLSQWNVPDEDQQARIERLRRDWADLRPQLPDLLDQPMPLDQLIRVSQVLSVECQELVVSLVLEPFGELVDGLTDCMGAEGSVPIDPRMDVAELRDAMARDSAWAQGYDFGDPREDAQFWYVSEDKQEPRLGLRYSEPGGELESPLDIARQMQELQRDLQTADGPLADFLRTHPQHRSAARRVQLLATHPYAEIRDNLICERCKPIDMLRCKLAFFGAAKFDPKSDRWTRITLAQGAPLHDELDNADDWWLPVFEI